MQWDNYSANQTWLRDRLAILAKIRSEHASTRRGTRQTIGVSADVLVYKMSAAGDAVFVALNRGDSAQQATNLPAGNYVDLVSGNPVSAPLTIPARTAVVLSPQ
jgi:hypothetical protein